MAKPLIFVTRKFECHVSYNQMTILDEPFKKFNVNIRDHDFHESDIGGRKLESVFFYCTIDANKFDEFIEYLRNLPQFAIISIAY